MNLDNYKEELNLLDDMHQSYSLLFIALNKIQTDADANLKDITLRQLMLLITVAHLNEEEATIIRIADTIGTSKQNITRLVNSMIKSGCLVSTPSSTDKRSVNIKITEKGLAVMKENTIISNQYFLKIFNKFTKEEISSLRNLLSKLADYDDSGKQHLETKAPIDIEKDSEEMSDFLKDMRRLFF